MIFFVRGKIVNCHNCMSTAVNIIRLSHCNNGGKTSMYNDLNLSCRIARLHKAIVAYRRHSISASLQPKPVLEARPREADERVSAFAERLHKVIVAYLRQSTSGDLANLSMGRALFCCYWDLILWRAREIEHCKLQLSDIPGNHSLPCGREALILLFNNLYAIWPCRRKVANGHTCVALAVRSSWLATAMRGSKPPSSTIRIWFSPHAAKLHSVIALYFSTSRLPLCSISTRGTRAPCLTIAAIFSKFVPRLQSAIAATLTIPVTASAS